MALAAPLPPDIYFLILTKGGLRFETESILDLHTHFKPIETFQYTHFSSCDLHQRKTAQNLFLKTRHFKKGNQLYKQQKRAQKQYQLPFDTSSYEKQVRSKKFSRDFL